MYDELIKNLRHDSASALQNCEFDFVHDWMLKAADAIEELEKQLNEANLYADFYKEHAEKCEFVADDLIKQLRKSEADNVNLTGWLAEEHAKHLWIPVTERLPELHEIVLVADKANDIGMGTLEPLWDGTVWVVPFEDVDNEFCPISHWMSLPEPPEKESEA